MAMNEDVEHRISAGLRAHFDSLASLAPGQPTNGTATSGKRRLKKGPFGAISAVAVLILVGSVLVIPHFAAGPNVVPPAQMTKVSDGPFTLSIQSDKAKYQSDEPVGIVATLTYDGSDGSIAIAYTGEGPVIMSVSQASDPIPTAGGSASGCRLVNLERGNSLSELFGDTGTLANQGSNPPSTVPATAPFMAPGSWTFRAEARFAVGGDCGAAAATQYELHTEVVIPVSPG
jgi:hypothetical protein